MSAAAEAISSPKSHCREHLSVLAAAEKRALIWLAERLPGWVSSDQLTFLGAVAMGAAGLAFALVPIAGWMLLLMPLLLAVNWFGDSLDGTLARVRNRQRPRYGYYLDHVVDLANATMIFGGLALSGLCSPWIAGGLLVGYLLLCAESFLATHAIGVFRLSFGGIGPTELRILLSVGALVAFTQPVVTPFGIADVRLFDLGGLIGAAGMGVVFVLSAVRNARALARQEPLSPRMARPKDVSP